MTETLVSPARPLVGDPTAEVWYVIDGSGSMNLELDHLRAGLRAGLNAAAGALDRDDDEHLAYRLVKFSRGAEWLVGRPVPVAAHGTSESSYYLPTIRVGGTTDLGAALTLVAAEIEALPPPHRRDFLPVAVVVVTDGQPTDDYRRGIARVGAAVAERIARHGGPTASFLGIGLGDDAEPQPLFDLADAFPAGLAAVKLVRDPKLLPDALATWVPNAVRRVLGRGGFE